jgi:hypothetical protein
MKVRYLTPILLVILIVGGMLGVSCDNSSRLTPDKADKQEQKIIELQRQNQELRSQLDALSAAVEGLKQKQSTPSYQPPLGQPGSSPGSWTSKDSQRSFEEMDKEMKLRKVEERLKDLEHKQKYGW